jgi:hypothetical protein
MLKTIFTAIANLFRRIQDFLFHESPTTNTQPHEAEKPYQLPETPISEDKARLPELADSKKPNVKPKAPKARISATEPTIKVKKTSKTTESSKGNVTKKAPSAPKGYVVKHIPDAPEKIENDIIYVVGENGYDWLAVFRCPCGCDRAIHLNLLKDTDPSWSLKYHSKKMVSITPSVNRTVGCRSHFFITKGQVQWR